MEDSKDLKEETKLMDESPSRSKDLTKTLPEEAFNNFLQGKRHMLVQDYSFAVQSLSTACELYTQHFGELALECGEVHFLYGKALFRLSQQQAGILGGALSEEATEDDDEEDEPGKSSEEESKENEESEKNDSDTENGEENPDDAEAEGVVDEEKEPSESTDSPQHVEETSKEANEKGNEAPVAPESEVNSNEEQQEAEEDDLELAWNSLETAKSIFQRQGENVEAQLKVAEILQLLAEISMESDNNQAAINDLKTCLEIKKRHLKPDDRLLAETYYQMGLAQMLEKMYNDALDNFRTTVKILELRIENLKSTPVTDVPGSFDRADTEKEIEDLESVLSDIREKIEDTRELIEDAKKAIEEHITIKRNEMEKEDGFSTTETTENKNKPVSNITHLLKRKKPDQADEERDSKRSKPSSGVQNGDAKATVTE